MKNEPATTKQISYIQSLLEKVDSGTFFQFDQKYRTANELTKWEASKVIAWLKEVVDSYTVLDDDDDDSLATDKQLRDIKVLAKKAGKKIGYNLDLISEKEASEMIRLLKVA